MEAPRFLSLCLLSLCTCLIPSRLTADNQLGLKSFDASFQVKRNSITLGTLHLQLDITDSGRYHYRGHTKPSSPIDWVY